MPAKLPANAAIRRNLDIRLTARSLAPRVLSALQVLGFELRDENQPIASEPEGSTLWLVDETRLDELPDAEAAPDARILLITSPRQNQHEDLRIVAQAIRPARLGAIYSMVQSAQDQALRKTARISTQLSARCIRADRQSLGAVLSLSEGGCLLRTGENLRKGAKVDLQFALPEIGLVSTPARCLYIRKGDAGMEFLEPAPGVRSSIEYFVTAHLAETLGSGGGGGPCSG